MRRCHMVYVRRYRGTVPACSQATIHASIVWAHSSQHPLRIGDHEKGGGMTINTREPVTYGTPDQAAKLYEGMAKLIKAEPNRTFADNHVRTSARQLAHLLLERLDGEAPNDC